MDSNQDPEQGGQDSACTSLRWLWPKRVFLKSRVPGHKEDTFGFDRYQIDILA